jgi:hypothetical protein
MTFFLGLIHFAVQQFSSNTNPLNDCPLVNLSAASSAGPTSVGLANAARAARRQSPPIPIRHEASSRRIGIKY